MTNEQHPIVLSEGLKEEWESEWHHYRGQDTYEEFMARQAAQWGADQELAAIFEMVGQQSLPEEDRYLDGLTVASLRAARRPEPPNLKAQALEALDSMSIEPCWINGIDANALVRAKYDTIRRALEQLND